MIATITARNGGQAFNYLKNSVRQRSNYLHCFGQSEIGIYCNGSYSSIYLQRPLMLSSFRTFESVNKSLNNPSSTPPTVCVLPESTPQIGVFVFLKLGIEEVEIPFCPSTCRPKIDCLSILVPSGCRWIVFNAFPPSGVLQSVTGGLGIDTVVLESNTFVTKMSSF